MNNLFVLEDVILAWKYPANCNPPKFPIVYFEVEKAEECRGFLELTHLVGDPDFSGYPLHGEDIIIDSNGYVYKLGFNRYVFPEKELFKLTEQTILDYFLPAIYASKDINFFKKNMAQKEVENIVTKVAERFSW